MWRAIGFLVALILAGAWAGTASAACSPDELLAAGQAVKAARAELMAIHVGDEESSVDAPARAGIEHLKDRLQAQVRATMACAPEHFDPTNLQAELETLGGAGPSNVHSYEDSNRDGHGKWLSYAVSRPAGHPDLIGVVTDFGIECGGDGMLMLYQRRGGAWVERIARRSPPYKEISGAWMDLAWKVSPPDRHGLWFVATRWTPPWCTSNWRSFMADLMWPGEAPQRPTIFFHRSIPAWLGDENVEMTLTSTTFELRDSGSMKDASRVVRRHVYRYGLDGRRIPPVAENPRDFADEWIASPWRAARAWSAPAASLKRAWASLAKLGGGEYRSVLACRNGWFQVEYGPDEGRRWFLFVSGKHERFRLERVTHKALPACVEPDLTPSMERHTDTDPQ